MAKKVHDGASVGIGVRVHQKPLKEDIVIHNSYCWVELNVWVLKEIWEGEDEILFKGNPETLKLVRFIIYLSPD